VNFNIRTKLQEDGKVSAKIGLLPIFMTRP
jgi:hypothetical protein